MEKNVLIVVAGQLRTWKECKPYLQRVISNINNYCSVDVLFVIPDNFVYQIDAEFNYSYTVDDLGLNNCSTTIRLVTQKEINDFVKLNFPQTQWSEKTSYYPLINFWFYRLISVFEKRKLERQKQYDMVCFTRPDYAYLEPTGDFTKNIFPGVIIERNDVSRFSQILLERKSYNDGKSSGSVTKFRNDMVEQMSSSTYDLYNSALLNIAEYHDVDVFGSMTYHEIPTLFNNDFFFFEPHYSNNGFLEYSSNDMIQRGNLIRFNYVVINSNSDIADRLHAIIDRYNIFGNGNNVSQFVFRKVFVGSPNYIDDSRIVSVASASNALELAREQLSLYFDTLSYDIVPSQLDFKTITLIDADDIDWETQFVEQLDYQSEPGMLKTTFSIL